jgi:hypothetical protein
MKNSFNKSICAEFWLYGPWFDPFGNCEDDNALRPIGTPNPPSGPNSFYGYWAFANVLVDTNVFGESIPE